MIRWGYKTVHFEMKKEGLLGGVFLDETEIEQELNEFGRNGWELVSMLEMQDGIIAFFKQPLGTKPAADRWREEVDDQRAPITGHPARPATAAPVSGQQDREPLQPPARPKESRGETNTIGAIRIE